MHRHLSSLMSIAAGEDYIEANMSIIFAPGFGRTQCIQIPLLNDDCVEDFMESFTILLSSPQECVVLVVQEVSVYILEDDGK